jgi:hypothetical protein
VSARLQPCFPHRARFSSFGSRFDICVSDVCLVDNLRDALPFGTRPSHATTRRFTVGLRAPGACRCGAHHGTYDVVGPGGRVTRWASRPDRALLELRAEIKYHLALVAPSTMFVHAGVVEIGGRALMVPGTTRSGKTTLVAALVRQGAAYLSDDLAPIDGRGRVHPYPQPLGMRVDGEVYQAELTPHALDATIGSAPRPIGAVVLTHHESDARWRPGSLSAGHLVLSLMEHTFASTARPAWVLRRLTRALAGAEGFSGPRGDADETAALMIERFNRR